jgi:hypothetical protein
VTSWPLIASESRMREKASSAGDHLEAQGGPAQAARRGAKASAKAGDFNARASWASAKARLKSAGGGKARRRAVSAANSRKVMASAPRIIRATRQGSAIKRLAPASTIASMALAAAAS